MVVFCFELLYEFEWIFRERIVYFEGLLDVLKYLLEKTFVNYFKSLIFFLNYILDIEDLGNVNKMRKLII